MVWANWLMPATKQAIMAAFGADGTAVIAATNEYLNGIAASDKAKATALAGFINTYAVEDAHIVYSLIPTLNVDRWIDNGGTAWINTGYTPLAFPLKLQARVKWNSHGSEKDFFGNYNGSHGTSAIFVSGGNGNSWYMWAGSAWTFGSISNDVAYDVEFNYVAASGRKGNIDGTEYTSTASNNQICTVSPEPIGVFSGAGTRNYCAPNGKITFAKIECGGELVRWYVPFIRNNEAGLLDLINGDFCKQYSVGSFTISETPTP